jgi:ribonuclease BN (tRNA processing enzyme)
MEDRRDANGLTEAEFLAQYDSSIYPHQSLTADVVIFRTRDDGSSPDVLLIRRKNHPCIGQLALPGGFAEKGETIETEDGLLLTPEMVLGPPRKGLKLVYSTDTRPCENLEKYAQGADLLICEGMYGEPENAAKAREKKHMTFVEAATIARKAAPKQMWLTHYSPSLIKPDDFMPSVRKIFPDSKPGRDGRTITLAFDNESGQEKE